MENPPAGLSSVDLQECRPHRTEADAVIEQTPLGVEPKRLLPGHVYAIRTQDGHQTKDQVDVKAPKPVRESSIWFYNKGQRGLTRKDPNQGELDLAAPIPLRPRVGTAIAVDRSDRTSA